MAGALLSFPIALLEQASLARVSNLKDSFNARAMVAGLLKSAPKELLLQAGISRLENGGHPSWTCGLGGKVPLALLQENTWSMSGVL